MSDSATPDKTTRRTLKILLPILILAVGIGGLLWLIKTKAGPQPQPQVFSGVLVEVTELKAQTHRIQVRATGTVQTDQEITLVPEVNGRVSWLSPKLVAGGFVQTGELLVRLEADDYQLAVERARAEVARAEVALASERERAKVARQEWQRVPLADKGEPGPLVTRELQLEQEQANLAAAGAALKQAELNLQRTAIRAPFNARIRQEAADLGQYLRAGAPFATLAGTDRAEIVIPLPAAELPWLTIPQAGTGRPGSAALIHLPGATAPAWEGRIVRSLGEIDPDSRMATLVVAVTDPYGLAAGGADAALSNGQFVEILLQGAVLNQVVELPRSALRDNDSLWLMDQNQQLRILPVEVLRRTPDLIVARAALTDGARLVLTPVPGAATGLRLRTAE